jgi:hypothetical protein
MPVKGHISVAVVTDNQPVVTDNQLEVGTEWRTGSYESKPGIEAHGRDCWTGAESGGAGDHHPLAARPNTGDTFAQQRQLIKCMELLTIASVMGRVCRSLALSISRWRLLSTIRDGKLGSFNAEPLCAMTTSRSPTDLAAYVFGGGVAVAVVATLVGNPRQSALDTSDGSLAWRRRYFFKYEHRLRAGSSRAKVFRYFANHHNGVHTSGHPSSCYVDDYVMNACDVMRSLCGVYPHGVGGGSVVRSGGLRGEDLVRGALSTRDDFAKEDARIEGTVRKLELDGGRELGGTGINALQALSDADGEQGMSFLEWLLVDILLSYEEADLGLLFRSLDLDESGTLDARELEVVLRTVLESSDDEYSGTNMTSIGGTVAKMLEIMEARGSKKIVTERGSVDLEAFVAFFRELRVDIQRLHFAFYCEGGQTRISATNLLTSIVAHSADLQVVDRLLDRIQGAEGLACDALFSFETFQAMHDLVGDELRDLLAASSLYCRFHASREGNSGCVTRQGFRSSLAIMKGAKWLAAHKDAVDALFWLFARETGEDGGRLYLSELHAALASAHSRHSRHGLEAVVAEGVGGEFGQGSKLRCVLDCMGV